MRVVILTEGGKKNGLGHIARSISLYQAFRKRKITPRLIISGDIKTRAVMKGIKFESFNWSKNKRNLLKSIRSAEIVIVDSYIAGKLIYKTISSLIKIPVFIDDFKRLDYPRGIIVSPSAYGQEIKYPRNIYFDNLLGPKYVILRKEFCRSGKKLINKYVKNIMLTFGGYDLKGISDKIIVFLNEKYPFLNKIVVAGKKDTNKREKSVQLVFQPQAKKMKEVMLKSDVAISAGGQTLYELARMGTPTIGICTAKNQELNLASLRNKGVIEYMGSYNPKKIYSSLSMALEKFMDYKVRLKHSKKGRKIIDGKGAIRIVESLIGIKYLDS